jgi:Mg-chelatase subunit ChlD
MNEETHNSTIEPELEARIVALVLGEASDFETEELHRLIALRPELAAFQQEMQQVHGLMQTVGAGELETPDANWKLSADRRQSVLAVIRGEAATVENAASLSGVDTGHVAFRAESLTQPLPGASAPGIENPISIGPEGRSNLCVDPSGLGQEMSDHRWLTPPAEVVSAHSGLNPASTGLARRLRTMLAESLGPFASSVSRRMRKTPMKIAAGICVAGFIGLMTVPQFFRQEAMVTNRSNQWSFSKDSVASTNGLDVGVRDDWQRRTMEFSVSPETTSTPEIAEGENASPLTSKRASADDALASSRALSSLQQTLSGGGLAANGTDHVYSSRWRAVVPPSSASEGWFAEPLDVFESNTGSSIIQGDASAPISGSHGITIPQPSTTWEGDSLGGRVQMNPRAAEDAGVQPDWLYRAPLLAGTIDRTASPELIAAGDAVDESIPKLMIKSEEESLGKSLSLAVTDSGKTLDNVQANSGEHPFAGNPTSGGYAGNDKSGYAVDGKSDGEQPGKEPQRNEALGQSGDASDFGTMARGLSDQSDESGVVRRWADPGQAGSGIQPESARGGRKISGGNPNKPSGEPLSEMPADANGEASEFSKDEISGFEFTVPESVTESVFKERGENAKQVEEQDWAKNLAEGKSPDFYMGHRFDIDQLDLLQPLAESKSKEAAQPESDFDDDGLKDITALSKKNESKEQSDESRRQKSEPESRTKGQNNVYFRQGEAVRSTLADSTELEKKPAAKPVAPSAGLNETNAAAEAFSTFSLHVSDVSFKLAAAALARGEWPEAAKIRIEEFVNAFDYGDPLPGKGEKVACVVEQGIHPFLQQRNVMRVSMRTSAEGRATNTPLRLTFVLDNSGSMERIDRQQTVRRAFTLLSKQLTAIDQVTLISFSRQPRLLAENVSGTESGKLVELMEQLPSEGGTNIEAALQLAFEKASAQQTPGAQNRIVLLTDGAVNLGNANPESLSQMVESMRAAGIAFDAAGISADGLNDEVLEALTRKGDGRYYLMDSGEAADDNFAQQIAGALRPSASNVKVQVEFNPKRVGQYKLLGFEKHLLKQEDFRNDAVDAAEMAAAEAGVAMYQFEAMPDGEGDVGSVSVRFRDLSTGEMVEHRWPIPYEPEAARPDQATASLRIATTAAMLAAKLKGEALGESVDLQTLSQLIDSLPSQNQSQTRVQQLKFMIEQARQISKK